MEPNITYYRNQFLQEAKEILENVYDDILKAESDPSNQDILNSIFRGIHTLKGSAGTFNLDPISAFAHHLESLLNALREEKIVLSPKLVDAILQSADHLSKMIVDFESGNEMIVDEDLVLSLTKFTQSDDKGAVGLTPPSYDTCIDSPSDMISHIPKMIIDQFKEEKIKGRNLFQVNLHYTSEMLENGYDPSVFLKNLKQVAFCYYALQKDMAVPAIDTYEPLCLYLNPTICIAVELSLQEISDLTFDASLVTVKEITFPFLEKHQKIIEKDIDQTSMKEFLEGAAEMINSIEQAAIRYEETSSKEDLNAIFRVIHNIKGDSDFIGLNPLAIFSHLLESFLEQLRSGKLAGDADRIDIVLQSIDFIRRSIHLLAKGEDIPPFPPVFETLKKYENAKGKKESRTAKNFAITDETYEVFFEQAFQYKQVLQNNIKEPFDKKNRIICKRSLDGLKKVSGYIRLKELEVLSDNAILLLQERDEIKFKESVIKISVFIDGLEGKHQRLGEILIEDGKISSSELDEILSRQKPIGKMLVESGKISEEDLDLALKKQGLMDTARQIKPAATTEPSVHTIRVDEKKVELFTNLVGELLIARNSYDYLLQKLAGIEGNYKDIIKGLRENLYLFSRLTNEVHHGVMSLRMIPLRGIFQRFQRVVRDISKKQNKSMELIIDGQDIEIDKKVADILADPLVHLVRNACDHGIESVKERSAKGKPEKGTVILRASQEGNQICIRVIDDGKGMNRQALFDKAKAMGIGITSPDDPSLFDIIFLPGFSTKSEVTDISGRGVGMDVVKTTVSSLGGSVQVISEENHGTQITLSIPMTMGIETVLCIEAAKKPYAIPLSFIVETLKIPVDKFRNAGKQKIFHYRGEVLAARSLSELLFEQMTDINQNFNISEKELSLVIVKTMRGKFGLIVDCFNKNMEIAIKPIPDIIAGIRVFSGVSIMGDGKILLILNPEQLVI